MGHALRVRIIFDRVSFLVYFLKYLWSITRWDNFRLCIIFSLYSKVVMFNHTLGSILIEYHVRSNLLKVCFVASYHFFNLGSSLVQYGGYSLSTNGIIFGWVFVSRINFSLMITKAEKIVIQNCHKINREVPPWRIFRQSSLLPLYLRCCLKLLLLQPHLKRNSKQL